MDMQVGFSHGASGVSVAVAGAEYARLAEQRNHVFALIGEFRRAVARPGGQNDAIRLLRAILPCSGAYFAVVESLVDSLTAAGAAPHRAEHRHILAEMKKTLDRCSAASSKPRVVELAHALDTLLVHEAAILFRAPRNLT
jgi:hypothetical protein